MNRSQAIVDLIFVAVITVCVHYIIHVNNLLEISETRSKINDDQLSEIMFSLINGSTDNDIQLAKNQGVTEGILKTIRNEDATDEFHELWHNGYYSGLEQNKYIAENSYEDGYHTGMEHALRDVGLSHPQYEERPVTQDISEEKYLPEVEVIKTRAKLRSEIEPEFDKKMKNLIEESESKLTSE